MTRSVLIVIAIALLSMPGFGPTAQAQPPQRFEWDSGVVPLGLNQVLRVGITLQTDTGEILIKFQSRRMGYSQGPCNGGVCKHTLTMQSTSGDVLAPGEAASIDIPNNGGSGVRGIVVSNRRNLHVTFLVIDTTTGDVVACITENASWGTVNS